MNRWILFTIIIALSVYSGGICTAVATNNLNDNPSDYSDEPPYYPADSPTEYPTYEPTFTIEPTDYPTYEPTFTIEPTQNGGGTGYISIDSFPQGADVYFDGISQGTTPVTVSVSSTGTPSHTIRVSMSGYQEWSGHVSGNPAPGETIYQNAYLVEIQPTITVEPTQIGGDHGWVYVDSVPQGANVYFDGVSEGITPVSVRVSSTGTPSHTIRLSKSGYQDWYGNVAGNPGPGQTIYADAGVLVEIQPTITIPPTIIGDDYGWFRIVPIPELADVTVDGTYIGTGTQLVKIFTTASPSHDLLVRKSGYADYRQHLSYNPGKGETITLYASLVPLAQYGSIYVTSDPSGALATLDSGVQYLTPCTFTQVQPGMHTVSVSKSGYFTNTRQVQVNYDSQNVYVPLTKMQSTGTLYVDSVPQGADVKVDNVWQGQTPDRIGNLAPGDHTIRLQLAGYQTMKQQVMITAGQETQITPSLVKDYPEVQTGSVSVSSNPPGATVYLNADYQGVTPVTGYLDLTDLTPGVYTILLKASQHEDFSNSISVIAGQTTPVNVELKSPPAPSGVNGTLSIISSPSGAQVYLDNHFVGVTPLILNTIAPGEYGIVLKMDGYDDYVNRVQIAAGMTTPASVNLTAAAPPVTPTPVHTQVPQPTRSPLSVILIPTGLAVALLLFRRS
jgi:hypothetical protein